MGRVFRAFDGPGRAMAFCGPTTDPGRVGLESIRSGNLGLIDEPYSKLLSNAYIFLLIFCYL